MVTSYLVCVCNLFIYKMEVCMLGSSYMRDIRTQCGGSLDIPWLRERWEVRGGGDYRYRRPLPLK